MRLEMCRSNSGVLTILSLYGGLEESVLSLPDTLFPAIIHQEGVSVLYIIFLLFFFVVLAIHITMKCLFLLQYTSVAGELIMKERSTVCVSGGTSTNIDLLSNVAYCREHDVTLKNIEKALPVSRLLAGVFYRTYARGGWLGNVSHHACTLATQLSSLFTDLKPAHLTRQ